jgi:hypothetical protein
MGRILQNGQDPTIEDRQPRVIVTSSASARSSRAKRVASSALLDDRIDAKVAGRLMMEIQTAIRFWGSRSLRMMQKTNGLRRNPQGRPEPGRSQ